MVKAFSLGWTMKCAVLLAIIVAADFATAEDLLLQIQHSRAELEINSGAKHGQGLEGVTTGNPGDVWHYPNSVSCLLVYGSGRYVYEKRDEATLGRPKIKAAEGSFTAEEVQQMKAILDDEALRSVASPPMPPMPDDAVAIHEMETLNAQIVRSGSVQEFVMVKERVKTNTMTGLDVWLDNGAKYQKALAPLQKWFKDVEKKSKSALKDAQPKYCTAMNIG